MEWLKVHFLTLIGSGSMLGLLLLLWRSGILSTAWRAYRDQKRIDAENRCKACVEELAEMKRVLQDRVRLDDASDEIHAQDLADIKQMSGLIEKLKHRCRDNHVTFDDLV